MRHKSVSPQANDREWLESLYDKKRSRSYEFGVKAITVLLNEGKTVSYRTVAQRSKEIDPDGRGIHQNTITNNKELHDYFLQFSTTKTYKPRKKANKSLLDDLDAFKHIKLDRDVERVRQRYMQLTKSDLVELIIRMEQYISHQNKNWLKNEFEKFQ
ncbi:hypothetical protein SAMN05444162_4855 [Paenibacillaceae bacterium GAS479]|nr:hypothetical protein SAMN05444162_4855 [Paenibacillaceae bacterium GAS479]